MKYIILEGTDYNEDENILRFETKVAADLPGFPIIFCAYGMTEKDSRDNAKAIVSILEETANITSY